MKHLFYKKILSILLLVPLFSIGISSCSNISTPDNNENNNDNKEEEPTLYTITLDNTLIGGGLKSSLYNGEKGDYYEISVIVNNGYVFNYLLINNEEYKEYDEKSIDEINDQTIYIFKNLKIDDEDIFISASIELFSKDEKKVNERPLIFYHKMPLDVYGEIDKEVMSFNPHTFFVGNNNKAEGTIQGSMILNYIKDNASNMDRNKDGRIGYVLAIGQHASYESQNRTKGVREVLGTGNDFTDYSPTTLGNVYTKDGKTYIIEELAASEMRDVQGAWSEKAARVKMSDWLYEFNDSIDLVISNNDEMALSMMNAYKDMVIPTFGFGGTNEGGALINDRNSSFKGSVRYNDKAQAATILQLLKNIFSGIDDKYLTIEGIEVSDDINNKVTTGSYVYNKEEHTILFNPIPVTKNNLGDDEWLNDLGITNEYPLGNRYNILNSVNFYNSYLSLKFMPYFDVINKCYNFNIVSYYTLSDEDVLSNTSINLKSYDAYVINLVNSNNAQFYLDALNKASI